MLIRNVWTSTGERLKSRAAAALAIGLLYFHILSRFEPHVETAFHFIVQRTWTCWTCSAMRWRSSNRGVAVVTCCCMLLYTKCHSSQIRRSCQHDSGGPSHHAHGLCLHCLPNRQEMQIATACHLIQQVLIWLVLILGIPYGFVWYQYCNEENGHSHQYLDDRGCTSQGEFSTVCASTSKSGLCPSNVSGLRANHGQKRRWLHRVTRAPPKMCQSTSATYLAAMLNDPDVKFHTVTQ